MADICVYYFCFRDRTTGKLGHSKRRATLEAIRSLGEPVVESRLVVDSTEVDTEGFLVSRQDIGSYVEGIWCEIRSLRLRAKSRASEAKQLGESEAERRQLLCSESLELLMRANRLHQLVHPDRQTPEHSSKKPLFPDTRVDPSALSDGTP
jgi:hypothetical protein